MVIYGLISVLLTRLYGRHIHCGFHRTRAVSPPSQGHHAVPVESVFPDVGQVAVAGNTLTGRYPARGIQVRPHVYRAGYPPGALFFPQAVELRLRKIRRSLAQDIVAATQFTVLALQLFQAVAFSSGEVTITASGIALILTQPDTQGLRGTANFRGDEVDGRPLRVIVVLVFDNQSNGPLTDLRGNNVYFKSSCYLSLKEFSLQDFRGGSP